MSAAALAAALSCESATGPGTPGRLTPGDTIAVTLAPHDTLRVYYFAASTAADYIVYVQVLRGSVLLDVLDSTGAHDLYATVVSPTGRPLTQSLGLHVQVQAGGVYGLKVSPYPADSSAQLRFLIYEVNAGPESRAAAFSIGDTVSGESLEPASDIDQFTVHGDSGQRVVAVLQALAPAGVGQLVLEVRDTAGFLGYTIATPGGVATTTTGAIFFPVTGTYTFDIRANGPTPTPYHGAYQFWTYAINPAPEHHAAAIALNTEVSGEAIDRSGDVDEFSFTVAAGA